MGPCYLAVPMSGLWGGENGKYVGGKTKLLGWRAVREARQLGKTLSAQRRGQEEESGKCQSIGKTKKEGPDGMFRRFRRAGKTSVKKTKRFLRGRTTKNRAPRTRKKKERGKSYYIARAADGHEEWR